MSDDRSITLQVSAEDAQLRLDAFLAAQIKGWSRSRLQRLIDDGDVLVNDREAKPSHKLHEGDRIDVELTELPATEFTPEDIPLDIVYEDEYLAVINKPAGMIVHPGAGVAGGTLANAIAYRFGVPALAGQNTVRKPTKVGTQNRVGIVHRLDKDTSGLIVVAKDEQTAEALSKQFHDREVEKSYVALVHGVIEKDSGQVDVPIARDRHNRIKMAVSKNGRSALTLWRVKKRFDKFTLLDVEIKTGRTHQIRVHFASINHPVVGDETYNAGRDKTVADANVKQALADLGRFFLHSARLAFTHPGTGERLSFNAELPAKLSQFLDLL